MLLKNLILIGLFFIFSVSLSVQASETMKGAKKDFQEFRSEMARQLDLLGTELSSAKASAQKKGNEVKVKAAESLQEARLDLRHQLDRVDDNSQKAWSKFKSDFAESVDYLNKKIQTNLRE